MRDKIIQRITGAIDLFNTSAMVVIVWTLIAGAAVASIAGPVATQTIAALLFVELSGMLLVQVFGLLALAGRWLWRRAKRESAESMALSSQA